MRAKLHPLYTAKVPGGMLEVVEIAQIPCCGMVVKHRFNGLCKTTLVRQDIMGCHYFHAHGQKIYIADLHKVRCLN